MLAWSCGMVEGYCDEMAIGARCDVVLTMVGSVKRESISIGC